MIDLLAAINAALMPISAIFVWFFLRYQYSRIDQPQDSALALFSWSMFCISIGIFVSSLLYFLWDFDIIYKSAQYKLSVIPRSFFVAGLALSFAALEVRWGTTILIVALCVACSVLTVRVLW